ncbi:MAG: autotransporter domain-containing protein [Parachlamydia sp.]|nr:autotransporter domain-containing protein [Parachlamydia sp.]
MASLLSCSAANAFWPEATDSSLEIGVGYRRDTLEWKTSADLVCSNDCDESYTSSPFGVSSHLKWKNLHIWQIEAKGEYVTCDGIYFRASGDYGWINSGKNTDSDYMRFGDCSDVEFSCTHASVRGHVYDADVAVGYEFKLCDDSFSITPLVGYSWKGQHLRDRNLKFGSCCAEGFDSSLVRSCYSTCDYSSYSSDSCYSSESLNSRYHTRWNGPFIGFNMDYRFMCDWEFFLDYEYHWATYDAKAHWNLRTDLPSGFHHHAKRATGNVLDFGVKWDLCDCWYVALKGGFQWFEAKHGHDTATICDTSLCDVKTKCQVRVPLKDVKWHSESISLAFGMHF